MQNKGHSPAVELESSLANPDPGGRAARRGRDDHISPQDKPAAPRFLRGGGLLALASRRGVRLCECRRWATMTRDDRLAAPLALQSFDF